ncbi:MULTISPECIES: hypothetical protein [unclassified Parabacteroides]|uniref:hypothetical protein n=1 Tax=unclassified Parabacteroides TaxID=2649774 RepID=UPI0024763A20|nr:MULTISPECIES: hypothetical protein [unclassified Parabacteroides]
MKKRTNIMFSRFSIEDNSLMEDIFHILKDIEYTEDNGIGYSDLEINEGILYSTLIKRTITSILGFNPDINDLKKIEIPIYEKIPFCMDFNKNLLYSFGANANHNKIKSALRSTLETPLSYNDFGFTPVDIMRKISCNNQSFNIEEIIIKNFKYSDGVLGKYIAKISNQVIGKELINSYANDVLKVSINIVSQKDYYLIISSNTLSIKCEEDDFYPILENIKDNIHG